MTLPSEVVTAVKKSLGTKHVLRPGGEVWSVEHLLEVVNSAYAAVGCAVVKVPDGVAVEHGARLVQVRIGPWGSGEAFYTIEPAPKEAVREKEPWTDERIAAWNSGPKEATDGE